MTRLRIIIETLALIDVLLVITDKWYVSNIGNDGECISAIFGLCCLYACLIGDHKYF